VIFQVPQSTHILDTESRRDLPISEAFTRKEPFVVMFFEDFSETLLPHGAAKEKRVAYVNWVMQLPNKPPHGAAMGTLAIFI
jgi:hypothetical protein